MVAGRMVSAQQNKNAPDIMLREMEKDDIDAVLEIERACFSHPWKRAHFQEHLQYRPLAEGWLAEREEEIVGFLLSWYIAIYAQATGEVHILNIAVKPQWQRNGIGVTLLNRAVRYGMAMQCEMATLEVRESNLAAQGFYRKFNFQVTGRRNNYYGSEDALIMEASLPGVIQAINGGT